MGAAERLVEQGSPVSTDDAGGLTELQRDVLAFERQWWRHPGAKEQAVRARFGLGPTQYYQVLNALLDTEAALASDPMLVKRLRRQRASRQRTSAMGRRQA